MKQSSIVPVSDTQALSAVHPSATIQEVMREFEGCRFIIRGETFDVVAKDVAEKVLGLAWKGTQSIDHVPAQWRGVTQKVTLNNIEEILTLTEQGLYFFLSRSNSPKALPFQMRVSEMVKELRQNGRVESRPQTFEDRCLGVMQELLGRVNEQQRQLLEAKSKVEYYDLARETEGTFSLRDVAHLLGEPPNKFNAALADNGYLYRQRLNDGLSDWLPYAKYVPEIFVVKEVPIVNNGARIVRHQTRVTQRGKQVLFDFAGRRCSVEVATASRT